MKSTIEPLEGNKVKVVVEFDEAEFEPSIAQAWKEIAKEVRLPGFRPGKAPRKLLEKQFGTDYARSEALKNAVPEFYSKAVIEDDVDVIAPPELEVTGGETEGPVVFEAIVETRPVIEIVGHDSLRVEVPSPEATDDEIDEQIDRLRSQYGELTEVDRPAGEGDYVTIDLAGTQDGEAVDGLTADDYLYLIGSGMIASEFDDHLRGASGGDKLEFDADHPDPDEDQVQFEVAVKNVKERVLPELTDDWVAEATEFETVQELREDTRNSLAESNEAQTRAAVRNNIGAELAKLVEAESPEALISSEMQARLQNIGQQLQSRGIRLEDYLQITGNDPESFTAELKASAEESVKIDLALRAVVEAEGLQVTEDEIDEEVALLIDGVDLSLEDAREQLVSGGQMSAVRADVARRKAMEWLVEKSTIVDPEGIVIDAAMLTLPEDTDDHDHAGHDHSDHDHD